MPDLKIDKDGYLLNDQGARVEIGGEAVKITNARTQEQIDQAIQERLARQNERIKTLETQANKTPELERMISDLKTERDRIETEAKTARESAQQEVSSQLNTLKTKVSQYEDALKSERTARVQDQVTTLILSKAGDTFINPAKDLVPDLLRVHKREPVQENGKPVEGQFVDLFEVSYKNEKGEEVKESMPAEKAIAVLAAREDYAHYVRASGAAGSGGGNYTGGSHANLKRSEMNATQKSEFISKHGLDKFKELPS